MISIERRGMAGLDDAMIATTAAVITAPAPGSGGIDIALALATTTAIKITTGAGTTIETMSPIDGVITGLATGTERNLRERPIPAEREAIAHASIILTRDREARIHKEVC